jgi:phage tail-like protein
MLRGSAAGSDNQGMADSYLAVLAFTADGDRELAWQPVLTSVRALLAEVAVDWSDVHVQRTSSGPALLMPPSALNRVVGEFSSRMAAVVDGPELRLGLATGMCHHDGRGWFGDALTIARRKAEECRSIGTGRIAIVVTTGVYRELREPETRTLFRAYGEIGWLRDIASPVPLLSRSAPPPAVTTSEMRLVTEVIEELARPIGAAVEALPGQLSPALAPPEVLTWMYDVLGVDAAILLTERQGRRLLPHLLDCYRRRGTAAGLRALIELRYGVGAEVIDPGTSTWSAQPSTPGPPEPALVIVRLDSEEPMPGLDEVIRSSLPVAVGYRVERR